MRSFPPFLSMKTSWTGLPATNIWWRVSRESHHSHTDKCWLNFPAQVTYEFGECQWVCVPVQPMHRSSFAFTIWELSGAVSIRHHIYLIGTLLLLVTAVVTPPSKSHKTNGFMAHPIIRVQGFHSILLALCLHDSCFAGYLSAPRLGAFRTKIFSGSSTSILTRIKTARGTYYFCVMAT